jgi:ribosomal protein L11 methyltransferase
VLASDIDPVAVAIARENAVANGEAPRVAAVVADGLTNPAIAEAAPFDLIVANILAGPLTHLAPAIARALRPGGVLVLSGLLQWQENYVVSYYRPLGLILRRTRRDGGWSALVLERPRAGR